MTQGRSFGKAAQDYDKARPTYPVDAVAWAIPEGATAVADVGAGTGKLTGSLIAPGRTVYAVEPDEVMLDTLSQRFAGVDARIGTAEQIPLGDNTLDAVIFGQAWHWVDVAAASREVARVLRPDGQLGLIWNIRDVAVPWVKALGEAMNSSAAEKMIDADGVRVAQPFATPEREEFRWVNTLDIEGLVSLAASRSYVIDMSPADRALALDRVRGIGQDAADDDGVIHLPYVTHVFRTRADGDRG